MMLQSIQTKEEKFVLSVMIGIPVITLCLYAVIRKDTIFLIIVMALCISLIVALNFIYSKIVGDNIYYWSAVLFGYVIVLGLIFFLKEAQTFFFKTIEVSRLEKSSQKFNSILILGTLMYSMAVGGFYAFSDEFWQILKEGKFIKSVVIILVFLLVIFFLGRTATIQHFQESTKRKMFHLGPIIVTPIVYSINLKILVLILTASSFVFLALEVIRYVLKEINLTKNNQNEQYEQKKKIILSLLLQFFRLMQTFNSRQPYFWFTHLFLIMSLQLSYNIELVTGKQGIGHVVLIMIAADAMAAIVGKGVGRIKISNKKTLQGLLAFVVTAYLLLKLLKRFYIAQWGNHDLLLAFGCGLAELWSGNADNVTTLLLFWVVNLSTYTSVQL